MVDHPNRRLIALGVTSIALTIGLGVATAFTISGNADDRRERESTQDALCRFAQRSADTKDAFVDVIAERAGLDDTDPAVIELHRLVTVERGELVGYCPPPPPTTEVP